MKNLIYILFLSIIISQLSNSCISHNHQDSSYKTENSFNIKFPKPIGYVNDYAKVLKSDEVKYLESKLKNYEKSSTNQVAIVTLNFEEITVDNFDEYALELSKFWGVGRKDKDNGLSIVFSPNFRRIRISTGLGTEKILTDSICQSVLDTMVLPEF